jgi:hypothetical protein
MSSTFTSLRFRLLSSWNGMSLPEVLSIATASASSTNDFVFSLIHCKSSISKVNYMNKITHPWKLLNQIWVFRLHILGISAEHTDAAIFQSVYLGALAVILVLARELPPLEAVEHLADRFRRFGEHWLERNTWRQLAMRAQARQAMRE